MPKIPTEIAPTATSDEALPLGQPADDAAAPQPITLDEFCRELSRTDKRVELIGAFFRAETRAGHAEDVASAFAERLRAFAAQPV